MKLDIFMLNNILATDFKMYENFNVNKNNNFGVHNVNEFPKINEYKLSEKDKKEVVEAFKDCTLINPDEIIPFVLSNNALDYIQKIVPFVKSYFPNGDYYFDYMPDPDSSELDYLTLSIKGVGSLTDNFDTVKEIELKILAMDFLNNSFKINFFIEVE
ncbi:MAG: hypothetical protein Q4P14_02250 [Methanobacteriaceae archaeon]|nr:hypothetical protein [Methanobacteriaceae archaeon]